MASEVPLVRIDETHENIVSLAFKPTNTSGFGPSTRVRMADGSIKEIKDIVIGDMVTGDDGLPHRVLSRSNGYAQMYRILQGKADAYDVTGTQILVLRATGVTPFVTTNSGYDVLVFCKRCSDEKCRVPNCSRMGLTQKRPTFNSNLEAEEAKKLLSRAEFDPDYVEDGDIFVMNVEQYFNACNHTLRGDHLQGFKIPLPIFKALVELPLDPYYLGMWLGDGSKGDVVVTTSDYEIRDSLESLASKYNDLIVTIDHVQAPGYISPEGIVATKYTYQYRLKNIDKYTETPVMRALKDLKVYKNKHIPDIYMNASEEDRYKLLAGLIDTDGSLYGTNGEDCCYKFGQSERNGILVAQFRTLALTLGFNARIISQRDTSPVGHDTFRDGRKTHIHYMTAITGKNMLKVPCLIERKKASIILKDHNFIAGNTSRIIIQPIIESPQKTYGEYIGIAVDGNNKFILSDCTVVSGKSSIAPVPPPSTPRPFKCSDYTIPQLKEELRKRGIRIGCDRTKKSLCARLEEILRGEGRVF